jgi:hypothetical protein
VLFSLFLVVMGLLFLLFTDNKSSQCSNSASQGCPDSRISARNGRESRPTRSANGTTTQSALLLMRHTRATERENYQKQYSQEFNRFHMNSFNTGAGKGHCMRRYFRVDRLNISPTPQMDAIN